MAQKVKNDWVPVRMDADEKAEYEDLAKNVYGFSSTSEFIRYALAYVKTRRPILGKSFAPEIRNN